MEHTPLSPAARRWFSRALGPPTAVQRQGWEAIARGENALLVAPTGSGKTLAAFLVAVDQLFLRPRTRPGWRVLYVSPLKALANDIEQNLRRPLAGLAAERLTEGLPPVDVTVDVRTGDTDPRTRQRQRNRPGDLLVTTPESLFLLLLSQSGRHLETVETVIIDEVHVLLSSKRGAHLALSVEWLAERTKREPQRIGLSATVRPLEVAARWLAGDRPVTHIEAPRDKGLRLTVEWPEAPHIAEGDPPPPEGRASRWNALHPRLLEAIRAHGTTLIFAPNRGLVERLVRRLSELDGSPLVEPHHGSMSLERRKEVETALKEGRVRGIVCTSTLEMGIDIPSVDLVVQVGAPEAASRGLQRVGRSGHQVGAVSEGLLLPRHEAELLDAAVVGQAMLEGDVEPMRMPSNPLDVLAQHVLAWSLEGDVPTHGLLARARRCGAFLDLPEGGFAAVLDLLSGRWQGDLSARIRAWIDWDRVRDRISARAGARLTLVANAGTIPDRGLFTVHLGEGGPRIGELDEEMAYETRPGDVFVLGASSWRALGMTDDRVIVEPAPGVPGKLPFWRGDGPGRPLPIARRMGRLLRTVDELEEDADALEMLGRDFPLTPEAAAALLPWLRAQAQQSALPTDRRVVIERYNDEVGEPRIAVLSPWGARVHAPWALAVEAEIESRYGVAAQALWNDDGFLLRLGDEDLTPSLDTLLPDPERLRPLILARIHESAWFSGRFRENAARALLLPRRGVQRRAPLWQQRIRSRELLAAALSQTEFPLVLETVREAFAELFDMETTGELLRDIRARRVLVREIHAEGPSPFSRALSRTYLADNIYAGDLPAPERRARMLAVDTGLLTELVPIRSEEGGLDEDALLAVVAELRREGEEHRPTTESALLDLLRRVGPVRVDGTLLFAEALLQRGLAVQVVIGGSRMLAAVEDLPRLRDALGVQVPPGVVLPVGSEPEDEALLAWIARDVRAKGPFLSSTLAQVWGAHPERVEAAVLRLAAAGRLRRMQRLDGVAWIDVDVLRRVRRRTLVRLRELIAPVPAEVFVRFLHRWQRVGEGSVLDAVIALEGLPLPWSELEGRILPMRAKGFRPRALDELGASGQIGWVGAGPLPGRDGRIVIFRRERMAEAAPPPCPVEDGGKVADVLTLLRLRGACFSADLLRHLPELSVVGIEAALTTLAWAGLVTNDSFTPLRSLLATAGRRRHLESGLGGRWSLVERGPGAPLDQRLAGVLDRWGIVSRAIVQDEGLPGGFTAALPVLRAWEAIGRVRRGHFVEGLDGAQFALPGAVDALRAARDDVGGIVVLPALDPAQPWGGVLPWPEDRRPRRAAGVWVVLDRGVPALVLEGGGRLTVWETPTGPAWAALRTIAARTPGRLVRILQIDDSPSLASPWKEAVRAVGGRCDHLGILLEG